MTLVVAIVGGWLVGSLIGWALATREIRRRRARETSERRARWDRLERALDEQSAAHARRWAEQLEREQRP